MTQRDKDYWNELWSSKEKYGIKTDTIPLETGTHDENLEYAISYLGLKSGNILEVGCGSGIDSRYLSSLGFDVHAIDISESAINEAKKHKSSVLFEVADINNFQVDKKFDVIYDRGCLIYSTGNKELFAGLYEMLSPDGHIIMINGNSNKELDKNNKPPVWDLVFLEQCIANFFRVILAKEISFRINPLFGSKALGWLFILKNKEI